MRDRLPGRLSDLSRPGLILAALVVVACVALAAPDARAQKSDTDDPVDPLMTLTLPDSAFEEWNPEQTYECLCRKLLARVICKEQDDVFFLEKRKQAFLFNAFYGTHYRDLYCEVKDEVIMLTAPAWGQRRISLPYKVDSEKRTISSTVPDAFCGEARFYQCQDEQE